MAYRKTYDEAVYRPFKPVIDKAMMLDVGEAFTFSAKPLSAKMAEQRIREYLRFMNEKNPDNAGLICERKPVNPATIPPTLGKNASAPDKLSAICSPVGRRSTIPLT